MARRLLAIGLAASLAGCASARPPAASGAPRSPAPDVAVRPGWTQSGIASWYGDPFHGRRTASGEVYDMDGLSAAHQTLPLGTRILVENRDNGRRLELRVNDRGPFARGRILDLSRAAARELGVIGPGTAHVTITVLEVGGDAAQVRGGCVVVQVASFRDRSAAETYIAERGDGEFALSVEEHRGLFRVLSPRFTTGAEAQAARAELGGFIRRCEPM